LILVLGIVTGLEGTWCMILDLELALLLIEIPRRLLGRLTFVNVVLCVVALHDRIVLVLE
jgi:hypothetical protein